MSESNPFWPKVCPKCNKPMTGYGFFSDDVVVGPICSYCEGKQRKAKRRKKKAK